MKTQLCIATAILLAATVVSAPAEAQFDGVYVQGSVGINWQTDSDNRGEFTADTTTGQGSEAIPAGTVLPAGTPVGWDTEFDTGFVLNASVGANVSAFRVEVEGTYGENDVDTHEDVFVTLGGSDVALGAQDAAVLIPGAEPLGVSVADVVADGQGDVQRYGVFANAYYDFENDSDFTPYIGGGIGILNVDVDYSPSDVAIIDDSDTVFAWQGMIGASYAVADTGELFVTGRYRQSEDATVQASINTFELDVENQTYGVEVGYRFNFN